MSDWQSIDTAPDDIEVDTKIHDADGLRNRQTMRKSGNLWWIGDMYVYYQPTHWRHLVPTDTPDSQS